MTLTIANFLIVQNKTNKTLHIKRTPDLYSTYDVVTFTASLPLSLLSPSSILNFTKSS